MTSVTTRHIFFNCQMELPTCALIGNRGTMVVRIMDVCDFCLRRCVARGPEGSYCGINYRCNYIRKFSDCDSVPVRRCRPCRDRIASSRFVSFCAAACLLLLVGGLLPRTSAAPAQMDQLNSWEKESQIWENPCGYTQPTTSANVEYTHTMASTIVDHVSRALDNLTYADQFAKITNGFPTFHALMQFWDREEWLRSKSWFDERMLPPVKEINQESPQLREYVESLVGGELDEVLPKMYKGMKLIVASFNELPKQEANSIDYDDLNSKLRKSFNILSGILCPFHTLLEARQIGERERTERLARSELPSFDPKPRGMLLVYRDTINYLQYLKVVFEQMHLRDA